jgi:hypothetical protein
MPRRFARRQRWRAITLSLFGFLLLLAAPARAESGCPAEPVEVEARYDKAEPEIDNTLPQPALQGVAGKGHHRGRALGLYKGELDAKAGSQFRFVARGEEVCLAVTRIEASVGYRDRRIWVIRERKPGTCAYDIVLGHERKHQEADDTVVEEFLPRLREALREAVQRLPDGPIPASGREAAMRRAKAAVEDAFHATVRELFTERERRQNAIDNPREYRRIAAACDPIRER